MYTVSNSRILIRSSIINTSTIGLVERELYKRLASMAGWDIAKHYGCEYLGDCSPIPHDGTFIDTRDWASWRYANIVELCTVGEGTLVVTSGTINMPTSAETMERAWECIGIGPGDPIRNDTLAQINAVQAYYGYEPDDYTTPRTYKLEHWQEWRIWRSIAPMLKELGS